MTSDSEPVPKLPRGRGLKLSRPELFRIALTLLTLVGVLVLTRPCADAVSGFVTSFDQGSDQGVPKPGTVDLPAAEPMSEPTYETLKPGMTEDEIKAAVERSKARAAGASAPTDPTDPADPADPAVPADPAEKSANTADPAHAGGSAAPARSAAGSASTPGGGSNAPAP